MHTRRLSTPFTPSEMACSSYQRPDDRGIVYNNSNMYFNVHDMYLVPDNWTSYEQLPLEPYYSYDAPALPPSVDRRDHVPRAWSGHSCSDSGFLPSLAVAGISYTPTLPSPSSSPGFSRDSEGTTPSPIQLNEFTNVFDSDFSLSLRHSYPSSSTSSPPLVPIARRRYSQCSPPRSPRSLSSDSLKSREPSPTNSDGDSKRRFPCQVPGCSRRFTSQYTLKVHTEAHKPKPRASFPCTLGCPESFSRQHDRLRHEVAKHGKICEFLCDECGRFFSSSKTLGNHKCPVAQGQTRWVHH